METRILYLFIYLFLPFTYFLIRPMLSNTFLFFCVCVFIVQSCLTLCDLMDYSPPDLSVHGIIQERILEWVAIPFSRESFHSRDQTQVFYIAGRFLTIWATSKASSLSLWFQNYWLTSCSLDHAFSFLWSMMTVHPLLRTVLLCLGEQRLSTGTRSPFLDVSKPLIWQTDSCNM